MRELMKKFKEKSGLELLRWLSDMTPTLRYVVLTRDRVDRLEKRVRELERRS